MLIKNQEMRHVLRCSPKELNELKLAFKEQMQQTYVNHRPFLGQLVSEVDRDGTLRDEMWQAVAETRDTFNAMLSGSRWESSKPQDFQRKVKDTKTQICTDLSAYARKRINPCPSVANSSKSKGKGRKKNISNRTSRTLSTFAAAKSGTPTPCNGIGRRVSERLKKLKNVKTYSLRLAPPADVDDPMEGLAPRIDDDNDGGSVYTCSLGTESLSKDSTPLRNDITSEPRSNTEWSDGNLRRNRDVDSDLERSHRDKSPGTNDPFRDSAEPTDLAREWFGSRTQNPSLSTNLDSTEPPIFQRQSSLQTPQGRPTLSTKIQQAVEHGVADLEARVTRLEAGTTMFREIARQSHELENRVIANIEAMLANRDAEIERLRAELEEERSWRAA